MKEKLAAAAQPVANPKAESIDVTQTHQVAELKHDRPLTTCRVDPTGRFVAAGAQDLGVHFWDLDSEKKDSEKKITLGGHQSWVRCIEFSKDGSRMFSACWAGDVNIWDTAQGSPKLVRIIKAHQGSTRWVRLNGDEQLLATCGNDLKVRVWNAADGSLQKTFTGHKRHVYTAIFHQDGRHIVSQDLVGVIHIWDLESGKLVRSIDAKMMTGYDEKFAADMGGPRDMQFSPDGSELASAGTGKVTNTFGGIQDPLIVLFDWKTGKEKLQLKAADAFKGIAWGVKYHSSGFIVGAGADRNGKGELWFYKSGKSDPLHTMKLASAARGLDLLGDNRLAVAHSNGAVRIYQMTKKTAPPAAKTSPAKKG